VYLYHVLFVTINICGIDCQKKTICTKAYKGSKHALGGFSFTHTLADCLDYFENGFHPSVQLSCGICAESLALWNDNEAMSDDEATPEQQRPAGAVSVVIG
jgi:hypothetical protein